VGLATLRKLSVPEALICRIHALKTKEGEEIRVDISSTEIRE
jgi:hypothetical protein